ncbi:hypothetical protein E3P92_01069 [Wallemia ichthyophaga]|nr:hypothetical protein E3P92_01069 [Wallemia ichthyophaga]TIB69793.1 hypothetical protein E3P77_00296 [Wallemia ichthyophaga]
MTIFYNQPSERNFPLDFFFTENAPVKRNSTPSTSKARLDLIQYGNSYEARVDLAGCKKEEVDISIHDHGITVKATKPVEQKSEENKSEKSHCVINERSPSTPLSRTWKLPEHITEDNIHAAYENGLLTLRYSRHPPESEPKKITIH